MNRIYSNKRRAPISSRPRIDAAYLKFIHQVGSPRDRDLLATLLTDVLQIAAVHSSIAMTDHIAAFITSLTDYVTASCETFVTYTNVKAVAYAAFLNGTLEGAVRTLKQTVLVSWGVCVTIEFLTAGMRTAYYTYRYKDGQLTAKEYRKLIAGAAGSTVGSALGSGVGAAIGTYMIPIPVVGTMVGAWAGAVAGDYFGRALTRIEQ